MALPRDPPAPVAPLFAEERRRLLALLRSLDPTDWERPTPCPGWSVFGLACHLVGDDVSVLARSRDGWFGTVPPDGVDEAGFITWLDDLQIEWVHAARRLSPRLVVELLAWAGPQLVEHLATQDPTATTAMVSWAGTGAGPVWLDQYRDLSEYWIHRQQLLEALGRVSDLDPLLAGPVLDALRWAYPYRLGTVPAEPGDGVTIDVTGPVALTWHLVRGGDGWVFTDIAPDAPLATMELGTDDAWRLLTNNLRRTAQQGLDLRGRADVVEVLRGTRAIIGAPQ